MSLKKFGKTGEYDSLRGQQSHNKGFDDQVNDDKNE
jgi:hypothetical protein